VNLRCARWQVGKNWRIVSSVSIMIHTDVTDPSESPGTTSSTRTCRLPYVESTSCEPCDTIIPVVTPLELRRPVTTPVRCSRYREVEVSAKRRGAVIPSADGH
jgi:hypothetical protein